MSSTIMQVIIYLVYMEYKEPSISLVGSVITCVYVLWTEGAKRANTVLLLAACPEVAELSSPASLFDGSRKTGAERRVTRSNWTDLLWTNFPVLNRQ